MLSRNSLLLIPGFFLITGLISCADEDYKTSKQVKPEEIFLDYRISGDEEGGLVTVLLQFRAGGPEENTLVLEAPAKVEFDGHPLESDRVKLSGVVYEAHMAALDFPGKHTIVFTSPEGKTYQEDIDFNLLTISQPVPDTISREDLIIHFDGLDSTNLLRVIINDTSFFSNGIDRTDTVRNGELLVSGNDLLILKNGPCYFEFIRESVRKPRQLPGRGGRIWKSYSLRRTVHLQD